MYSTTSLGGIPLLVSVFAPDGIDSSKMVPLSVVSWEDCIYMYMHVYIYFGYYMYQHTKQIHLCNNLGMVQKQLMKAPKCKTLGKLC